MTRTALIALTSHWRRNPVQLITLVLGLMLATALWSGVQALNAEARRSYDQAANLLAQNSIPRLLRADGTSVAMAEFVALRRAGYLVSPVIDVNLDGIRYLGVDALTAPQGTLPGDITADGAGLGLVTSSEALAFIRPGNDIALPGIEMRESESMLPDTVLADIATVADLTETSDPTYLLVDGVQSTGLPPIAQATDLILRTPENQTDLGDLTGSFHLNLTAFGLLSFGVGLFITYGAVGLAFEQRRPVFRTLRALGLPLRRLVILLAVELGALAALAGTLGVGLGYLIAAALLPDVSGTLRGLYGAPVPGELGFDPIWALAALAVAFLGAAIAGAQSLRRVARLPLLAPAQPRAWAMSDAGEQRLRFLGGMAMIGLGVVSAWFGNGLIWGFGSLAGLLGGAALILPSFLLTALRNVPSLPRVPVADWFVADTRQQVPGLSLALMALMLALSANIGVSTMVGSFRATFLTWIDQRLFAEIYIRADDEDQARAIAGAMGPEVDAVLPSLWVDRQLLGVPVELQGVGAHPEFPAQWDLLQGEPDAWTNVHRGEGLLISEQMAFRTGLELGDRVEFAAGSALPVAGIYADYGNPKGQITLTYDTLTSAYPEAPETRISLRLNPERTDEVVGQLQELGLRPDQILDQPSVKALSLRIFEQTFVVTGALNLLTLGVAAIALLTSFLTLASLRLPQVAPIWALGQTRGSLARLEMLRAFGLSLLTFVYALPVGLILAWILLAVINVEAFGWRLPMSVFPVEWGRLLLLSLVAAGLAALWPTLSLARTAPARLLQVFAYER